ncbi:MAG: sulfite exporter TauE/SafE family protein [Proteobacteria bacterium]|nr:sulfite exporter TauE/SafE family protein [Pseudomonadota bacterium]
MTYLILLLIFSGCLTGILAGLLGIGGGLIIVPVLAFVFHQLPETTSAYMQFAAGTSLGIIIFTALSSVPHKLRAREVSFDIVIKMLPWIISMNIVGAVIAHFLSSRLLGLLFALLMLFMFLRMLFQSSHTIDKPKRSGKRKSAFWGSVVGIKSGFFGIGGGIITIPYINSLGYSIRIAIGTSSLFTLIIAITGSITFIVTGLMDHIELSWSLGYLYLPAILCVVPSSMIFSKIGAKLSSKTPPKVLKVIFLVLLLGVSIKMLFLAI